MKTIISFGERMKFVIVYWSRFGNNKKAVEHLAGKLKERGDVQIFRTEEADPAAMPEADYYIFSAAVEAFRIQVNMKEFMKNLQGMEGKKYGIINTHWRKKKHLLPKMEKLLSNKKMVKIAEVDFRIGEGSEQGEGLWEGWEAKLDDFAGKFKP